MSLRTLMSMTVTIQRYATATDRYGDVVPTTATSTTVKAWISQRNASEVLGDRTAEISEWIAYLPAATDVRAADRITWAGQVFEVAGPPNRAHRPRTGEHHVEVPLRIVEG